MQTQTTRAGNHLVRRALLAMVIAAVATLTMTADAHGEGYSVVECTPAGQPNPYHSGASANPSAPDASYYQSPSINVHAVSNCNDDGYLGVVAPTSANRGHYASWYFQVPPGTYIDSAALDYNMDSDAGYQAYVRLDYLNGNQNLIATGSDTGWNRVLYDGDSGSQTLYVYLICEDASGCAGSWAGSLGRNFLFNMQDVARPHNVDIHGGVETSAWLNGTRTFTLSASDQGSGVRNYQFYVNGSNIDNDEINCDSLGAGYAARMQPCPSSATEEAPEQNLSGGAWHQGPNSIEGCVSDYAGERTCQSRTVNVDTVAPESVSGLTVAGGEAWKPSNDFDLSWSNPGQAHAPIDGAMYRITRVGGGYDSGAQFVSGSNRQSLSDLTVPVAGEYQVKLWARDAATNSLEANARTATLRFDPTVPPPSTPEYNGWIRRNDFSYMAKWQQVPAPSLGPSGLDGYAVKVTRDPATDPCVTDADPAATCSSVEVNNVGVGDTTMGIAADEVSEGQWYVHVVPVTGAGVKASQVKHTAMPVDETDPETSISGVSGEWVNHDVTVDVSASDALSGMSPGAGPDPQPRTCVEVDSGDEDCEPDDDSTRVISGDGEHQVRYYARDLAGNENSGGPDADYPTKTNSPANTATVRIDKSPPSLAFASARNAEDAALINVSATDELSGIAHGVIELRPQGSRASWFSLETETSANELRAYVPDDLDPGRYEFQASATDEAGNTNVTSSRTDGSAMVEELPLKEAVNLTASVALGVEKPAKASGKCKTAARGKGKGKGKCEKAPPPVGVPYGEPVRLSGYLQTAADAPLRGRELTVIERMAEGGAPRERTASVQTDKGGTYSIELEPGPSRTVKVRYAGEQRYRSAAAEAEFAVRSKVLAFKASKRVRETKSIRFRGRVGMAGVDLRSQGKRIELQYEKSKGNWRTIDSADAGPDGSFKLRYALRSNYIRPTGVRFRALVPPERAWPYVGAAASKPRRTIILP